MNLLNILTVKNLKLNKRRTIVTIIGIMLSVALITAVATMYSSAIKSLIKFETYQRGNFHVAFYNVDSKDLYQIENNKGVEETYLTKNIGYAKLNESKASSKPYTCIKAFTKDSLDNLSVKLIKGRMPQNENEIIIPSHLKTLGRVEYQVGDTITLDIGSRFKDNNIIRENDPLQDGEEIVDTTTITYTIVGIMGKVAYNIESSDNPGFVFITHLNNNDIDGYVNVYARYNKYGSSNYHKVTANILGINENMFAKLMEGKYDENEEEKLFRQMNKAKYVYDINGYLITLENNPLFDNETTGGLGKATIIVIIIIIITSVFCIKNSFDISITEKTKQYGMLRSVGATKKQIKKNVYYEGFILGLIGVPLGILLGLSASFILIIVSNIFLDSALAEGIKLYLKISYISIIVAIILGIITIFLSAKKSAKKASVVSPIRAITNSADIKIKSKKLKTPKIIKKLFGIGGEIAYKNYKRNKKRYRTTIISIIVSVTIFIALYYFMDSVFESVSNEVTRYDYNIELSFSDNNIKDKALNTLNLDNVEDYALFRYDDILIKNPDINKEYINLEKQIDKKYRVDESYITVITLGDYQYRKYLDSLNLDYDEYQDKAILFAGYEKFEIYNKNSMKKDKKYAVRYNYRAGDSIDISYMQNEKVYDEETKSTYVTNGNMVDGNINIGCVTHDKLPYGLSSKEDSFIIVSDKIYDKIINDNTMHILYTSNSPDKLQDDIDEMLKGEEYDLHNIAENARIMNELFTLVAIFLYGFIIVISLIGITNIFNTITTNMNLRKREFAMLKSIGMTSKEFNRMIRLESLFIGFKALIIGIILGLGASYIIYYLLEKESGLPFNIPIIAIIISIVVVYLLILLLMKYSMSKINKENTIETIRNENI